MMTTLCRRAIVEKIAVDSPGIVSAIPGMSVPTCEGKYRDR